MAQTQRSFRAIIDEADPKWLEESLYPPAYEFSNGRTFKDAPGRGAYAYGTGTGT